MDGLPRLNERAREPRQLAPIIIEDLTAAIRRMTADEGAAFILIKQHAEVALSLT